MEKNINRRQFNKTLLSGAAGFMLGFRLNNRFNVIIKNGLIIDGAGGPAVLQDIGITGDRIAAIGDLKDAAADTIIDADGMAVSPGFIDIHTHTDIELLVNPDGEGKIRQGITTEVSGNCGYSPFPLNDADYSELDAAIFEKYGFHINWKEIGGFLEALEENGISLNYATFTGHGNLRAFVMGKNDAQPTPEQMKSMKDVLARSMEKGSLGLSSGLEYAPGSYAKTEELIELSRVAAKRGGVYATHMRNEDDRVEEAVREALRICREAEVSLQISHLKACNKVNWYKADSLIRMIEDASQSGLPVHADRYPYTAWSTGLSSLLPLWSRQGDTEDVLARLNDPKLLPKIREYADTRSKNIGGWDRFLINSCYSPENKKFEGKSIEECAGMTNKTPFEFVRQLLIEEKNRVDITGFAMDEGNLKKVLASPLVMIGSDGSVAAPYGPLSRSKPHPRYYGTFPRVLGKYSREEKVFDLPTAVKKMTSMPAEKLGLKGRGRLREGYFADVVVFNPETVIDRATYIEPHQYPAGIEYVLVNGKITIAKGEHTGAHAGSVLRKS
ncbi:MAG: D-aminoacylase [Calditrichia bacterium]